jgi:hypothetical protein
MTVPGDGLAEEGEPELIEEGLIYHPAESIRKLFACPDCGDEYIDATSLGAHRLRDHAE